MTSSALRRALDDERPAHLVELSLPRHPPLDDVRRRAEGLGHHVTAFQLPDSPGARLHVGNVAAALELARDGHTALINLNCRDRNRIGSLSRLTELECLGFTDVFCIRGDPPDPAVATPVYDVTTAELLQAARHEPHPNLFAGAPVAPFRESVRPSANDARTKVDAGADFMTTQPFFSADDMEAFLRDWKARGFDSRARLVLGVPWWSSEAELYLRRIPEVRRALETPGAREQQSTADGIEPTLRLWTKAKEIAEDSAVNGLMLYSMDAPVDALQQLFDYAS